MKIKQLRYFGFHIAEIKEIIENKNEDLFEQKKKEYDQHMFQIVTSLQYLDEFKQCLFDDGDIISLMVDIQKVQALSQIQTQDKEINFDKFIFGLLFLALILLFFFAE